MSLTDPAGNSATFPGTDALVIDTAAPQTPLIDTVVTRAASPVVTGSAQLNAGEVLHVAVEGQSYTSNAIVSIDAAGSWSLVLPPESNPADGFYDVSATIIDAAGNATVDVTVDELKIDRTAPLIAIAIISDDDRLNNAELQSPLVISGTSDAADGTLATVTLGDFSAMTSVLAGTWQVSVPVIDLQALPTRVDVSADVTHLAGNASLQALRSLQVDAAGNTGIAGPVQIDKDTQAPVINIVSVDDGDDAILNATEAASLTVAGVVQNGVTGGPVTLSIDDGTNTVTATALLDAGLGWIIEELDVTARSVGLVNIVASISDTAGNAAIPAVRVVTLSTVLPSLNAAIESAVWDTTPLFTGTSNQSNDSLVELRTDGGVLLCTAVVINGAWQCEALNALLDGSYTLSARIVDVLGNPAEVTLELQVDALMDSDGDGLLDSVEGGVGCSIGTDADGAHRTDGLPWLMCAMAALPVCRTGGRHIRVVVSPAGLHNSCSTLRIVVPVLVAGLISSCSVLPFGGRDSQRADASQVPAGTASHKQQRELYRNDQPQNRFYAGIGFGASMLAPDTEETELHVRSGAGTTANVHPGREFSARISGEFHAGTLGTATLDSENGSSASQETKGQATNSMAAADADLQAEAVATGATDAEVQTETVTSTTTVTTAVKVPLRPASTDADNDGVPNIADACANTVMGIPVDDFGCALFSGVIERLIERLEFVGNTAQLTTTAKLELDRISDKLREYPTLRNQIATHADDSLSPAEATKLTRNQAITIARYHVSKGIDRTRLSARAYGSTRPLVPNTSAVRQKRNRRVEILPAAAPGRIGICCLSADKAVRQAGTVY